MTARHRHLLGSPLLLLLVPLLLASCKAAPPQVEEPAMDEIRLHEQLLERRTESLAVARSAVERSRAELSSLEAALAAERDPDRRGPIEQRLESARLRHLELEILLARKELKKVELEEELATLRLVRNRGTPLSDAERRERRTAALARRLDRANRLVVMLTEAEAAAVSKREKDRIHASLELEQRQVADLVHQSAEKK